MATPRPSYNRKGNPLAGRGTTPFDAALLAKLAKWRATLAHELSLRNVFQSDQALTEAVQRLLDRIVFVRLCEARGLARGEPMKQAWRTWRECGGTLYPSLVQVFRDISIHFHGGLFGRHASEDLEIQKNEVLDAILSDLYESLDDGFHNVPVEILGSIHERFIGSTIRLTAAGRVRIEEKPEMRHAGGVYYTPAFIVDAIVEKTLRPLTAGRSPAELLRLRVLDPACGSGSFLLGAFTHLIDAHLAYYRRQGISRSLTLERKKEILSSCIFGVDRDPQAIEVAQMSLYLKLMEGESEPSLARRETLGNLVAGNSLVSSQDLGRQSPLLAQGSGLEPLSTGLGEGGFDAVVGNPPYIRIQEMQRWAAREVELYKWKYESARTGNVDIYMLFVEQGLKLLKKKGRLGFILPNKFFQAKYGAGLRKLLAERKAVAEVVDFGDAQVFEGATTYTCLLFLTARPTEQIAVRRVRADSEVSTALDRALAEEATSIPAVDLSRPVWDFRSQSPEAASLAGRLGKVPSLGSLAPAIFQAPVTGADHVFLLHGPKGKGRRWRLHSEHLEADVEVEPDLLVPVLRGSKDLKPWVAPEPEAWLLLPYACATGRRPELMPEERLQEYPRLYSYLRECRAALERRRSGNFRGACRWYAYARPQNLERFAQRKFLLPYMVNRLTLHHDANGGTYFLNVTTGGYGFTLPASKADPDFVVGLFHSRLLNYLVRSRGQNFRGGYFPCNKQFVEALPVHLLDPGKAHERAQHDAVLTLVDRCRQGTQRLRGPHSDHERRLLERQLEAAERELDALVYELYGMSVKEREQVEAFFRDAPPPGAPTA